MVETAMGSVLESLLPSTFAIAIREISAANLCDMDSLEAEFISSATIKRQLEFAAGRAAAKDALRRLGVKPRSIVADKDRAPQWPTGFIGSIAHAGELAIAIVGDRRDTFALGIDIERNHALRAVPWGLLFQPEELEKLSLLPMDTALAHATISFCAKEAFFKMQFPVTKRWIDFKDTRVVVSDGDQSLIVVADSPLHPAFDAGCRGRFASFPGYTVVVLTAEASAGIFREPLSSSAQIHPANSAINQPHVR